MEIKLLDKLKLFFGEVRVESRKVTWSTKKELTAATLVVVIMVLLVASFIGLVDFLFSEMMNIILK